MAGRTEIERLELGRLERLDLRSFWGEQLPDLTPWFLQNIDLLGETLGIDITPLEREVNVDTGAFNVLGADALGRPIVIDNRMEATDHSQLGQLIVEASGLEAAVVIWVAPHFRDEFRRGLEWLNERTDQQVDFFGVEIGLVRIGRSLPAPVLDVVVQPRNWRRAGRRRGPLPMRSPKAGRAAEPAPAAPEVDDTSPRRGRHESSAPEPPATRYEPAPSPRPPRYERPPEPPPEPPPAARYDPAPEPPPSRYEPAPEPPSSRYDPAPEPPPAARYDPAPAAEPPPAAHYEPAPEPPPSRYDPAPPPEPPPAARYDPAPEPRPARYDPVPPPEPPAIAEAFAPAARAPQEPVPEPPAAPPPMASEKAGGLQPVELRYRFFEAMFDSVAIRRPGFRIPKFGYENWVGFSAGPFGFYDVAFTANGAVRAGIYLDMQERTSTKRLFDDLFAERLAVETAVGRILSWERLDDRRASRIVDYREVRDLGSREERRVVADWAAETVVKLMEALDDRLRSTAAVLLSRVQGGV
jgi:Domain of unknown function (DUF4268)